MHPTIGFGPARSRIAQGQRQPGLTEAADPITNAIIGLAGVQKTYRATALGYQ